MRVKFITDEGLEKARNNFKSIYKEILVKGNSDLCTLFDDENIIKNTSIEIEDFSLDTSFDNKVDSDLENIKRVYNHMKGLSVSKASDERIWVAYSLYVFVDYMKYRWMPEGPDKRKERYFFENSSKRSLFRQGISRLWWIGYLTYDDSRTDPYELTAFILRNGQDVINQLLDIGFSSNKAILKAVLKALYDAEKSGVKIDRELVRDTCKYVNLLGGTYILDCMSEQEIYDKVKSNIKF
jgi:hypothetical protein